MSAKGLWLSSLSLTLLLAVVPSLAQQNSKPAKSDQKRETVAKPLTEKERKRKEAPLKKELETPYRKWLNEDVAYIITDEERAAFKTASDRRGARAVHRAVLAAPRPDPGHRRERV